jgi:hypothetical protein
MLKRFPQAALWSWLLPGLLGSSVPDICLTLSIAQDVYLDSAYLCTGDANQSLVSCCYC